jgi:hypothetical protein
MTRVNPPRHRRKIAKLLLFLLAGAIINVGVAWGLTCRHGIGAEQSLAEEECLKVYGHLWTDRAPDGYEKVPDIGGSDERLGYWQCFMSRFVEGPDIDVPPEQIDAYEEDPDQTRELEYASFFSAGLPMHALWGEAFRCRMESGRVVDHDRRGILEIGPDSVGVLTKARWLPITPRFPGFAINTIFYAAIVWGLFAVPGAVRRRIGGVRRKRGQCAACGYSLQGIAGGKCPECGATI